MKNQNTDKFKKSENLVLDTAGGEMPDPAYKGKETAKKASEAFTQQNPKQKNSAPEKTKKAV